MISRSTIAAAARVAQHAAHISIPRAVGDAPSSTHHDHHPLTADSAEHAGPLCASEVDPDHPAVLQKTTIPGVAEGDLE